MIYFIPAWYNQRRTWYFNSRPWSQEQKLVRFDDISSHFERFSSAGEKCQLIVNNYEPQLRYFMHRLEILERNFINVFDIIQDLNTIKKEQGQVDFYTQFPWPEGIEFINTPFSVLGYLNGKLYAQIEFGDSGQLFWITIFENNLPSLRYIFDDRGFISSKLVYDQSGKYHYQDYYNGEEEWQIREFFPPYGNHVEVAEEARERFLKSRYETMTDLVFEVERLILDQNDEPDDIIFLAEDDRHTGPILEMKSRKKVIYSFFQGRNSHDISPEVQQHLQNVDSVIANSESLRKSLQEYTNVPVKKIPLFDARLDLGKSRQMKELIVYFRLDGLRKSSYQAVFNAILRYMKENKLVYLRIISFESNVQEQQSIRKQLTEIFEASDDKCLVLTEEDTHNSENSLQATEGKSRVQLIFMTAADDIIKLLNDCRVIIDGADDADLYTHIAAISAGIPQINRFPSEFVTHEQNGYIAETPEGIYDGLDYFLSEMTNWNRALTDSIQKTLQYSNSNLLADLMEGL
ncbi:accessory secretory protein Asp1 [Streptococcus henryi]|jgi:accessory secretory protein Asp1|uniref:Accessory secretory protein Asp1 n=1 Tax=Streptococcus henryi TaxID=439219 RepID=A0A1G6DMM6_9STRE|nr:accessory Sec system protein Asp1 [Streptococcus henryi]SDB46390.1 accessory secretory protein Asp1 [Streptococcus henryi]